MSQPSRLAYKFDKRSSQVGEQIEKKCIIQDRQIVAPWDEIRRHPTAHFQLLNEHVCLFFSFVIVNITFFFFFFGQNPELVTLIIESILLRNK